MVIFESIAFVEPWDSLGVGQIALKVATGERPVIPSAALAALASVGVQGQMVQELMVRCWHQDPAQRPSFVLVVDQLNAIFASGPRT
jgi:hypothetical protein